MRFPVSAIRIVLAAALVAACAAGASAQGAPHAARLTFDRAVRIPGATLAPGTYVFERVESDQDHRTVQIFGTNPRRLVATLMTVPTARDGRGADVVFTRRPRGKSQPVLREWYERGARNGYAFIYTPLELESIGEPAAEVATR